MADPDYSASDHWRSEQEKRIERLRGGGGGDRFDPMEPRVAALEEGQKRIEGKLDTLLERTFEMKGQLGAMPSASTFGDIKGALGKLEGRIDSLPTTAKLSGLFALAVSFLAIVAKWPDIMALLRP